MIAGLRVDRVALDAKAVAAKSSCESLARRLTARGVEVDVACVRRRGVEDRRRRSRRRDLHGLWVVGKFQENVAKRRARCDAMRMEDGGRGKSKERKMMHVHKVDRLGDGRGQGVGRSAGRTPKWI